jgi:hypothetical protein
LVDLIGIEPMTSSTPWNASKAKLQTAQYLRAGTVGKTGTIGDICCQNAAKFANSGPPRRKAILKRMSPSAPAQT